MTDRELMVEARAQVEADRYALQEVEHWRAQGIGAAVFALAMTEELVQAGTWTREEVLALVQAALRGR